MDNELTITSGLQQCFGITISNKNVDSSGEAIRLDNELYKTIEASLKKEFGNSEIALKISIDSNKYRKYYDGTYSSMINDSVSKIKHNGFESVKLIEVAKDIYDGINKNLSQSILERYNQHLLNIFTEVNKVNQAINDIIISEHLAKIESYNFFYEDLQEEINNIMVTPARRMAYLNTIVSNKAEIFENFIFLIGRLKNLEMNTNNCYQYTPSEDELKNVVLKTSFLIRVYLNSCIYEYVLAGNYTTSPKTRIKNRCEEMEKMLFTTLESLTKKYNNVYSFWNGFVYGINSNGFFVKDSLNSFDKNTLHLDYSELNDLDATIKKNLTDITIFSSNTTISSNSNIVFNIDEPPNGNIKEAKKKALKKLAEETEDCIKNPEKYNQDFCPNNY